MPRSVPGQGLKESHWGTGESESPVKSQSSHHRKPRVGEVDLPAHALQAIASETGIWPPAEAGRGVGMVENTTV